MIAAAYIRVSTEDQIEYSPDSQLKRIQEYAVGHNLQIPDCYIFVDEGISGRSASKRPAFQKMIALAKTKAAFEKILVWKYSRFARNRQDSIFYKSMLRKDCGVEVISITEPLSADPTSILIEALLEAMDEYYSINLAQEVRRGMQERFSRGKAISIPPFGYYMGTDSFEIQNEQAIWVQFIYQAYANGASLSEIASSLSRAGVRTKRGNPFETRSIAYILQNPVYVGKLRKRNASPSQYDRNYEITPMDYTDGLHPPIISHSLWNQVQHRWQGEHPVKVHTPLTSVRDTASCYYLQGLIQCDTCGSPLIHVRQDQAFQCSGYNHRRCPCSHYICRQTLEKQVHMVSAPFLPPEILACIKDTSLPAEKRNHFLHVYGLQFICYSKKGSADRDTDFLRIQVLPPSTASET